MSQDKIWFAPQSSSSSGKKNKFGHFWLLDGQLIHRLKQADISCTTTDRLFFFPLLGPHVAVGGALEADKMCRRHRGAPFVCNTLVLTSNLKCFDNHINWQILGIAMSFNGRGRTSLSLQCFKFLHSCSSVARCSDYKNSLFFQMLANL